MPNDDAERRLIEQAKKGDRVALQELFLDHYTSLKRHVTQKLPQSAQRILSAEDVVQETLLQAYRDIGLFDAGRPFGPWLKGIADNRLRDAVRRLERKKRGGDRRRAQVGPETQSSSIVELVDVLSARGHTPGRSVARREAVEAVRIGIAGLPPDQREAIRLRFLEGKNLEETALAMNRTPASVRSLVHRAKEKLRDFMGRASLWLSKKS
jgi:RNA polymerase sigma-70 factor (ECF subfamily)